MYFGDDVIRNIRESNDIVDVIGSYVNLKKRGTTYFGLCPFHGEKTPSFSVVRSKQMFYCFGCHKGGDVIKFMEDYENMSFVEAAEALAERAGIRLEKREETEEEKRLKSQKTRLMEVNREAASYYYYCLRDKAGERGFEYLKKREVTPETMKRFGLGYAPQSQGLIAHLKSKGFRETDIIDAGLASMHEKYGLSEYFWNRVIFPIMNINNKVVGFGGRVMGDGKPKYLNTRETAIFEKSRNLYGLNIAKNSRSDYLILCEGYMDVIAMQQAGFDQAVATLGTALTPNHSQLISRYVKKVLLIYDSDSAGIDAALRAIPLCRQKDISCRVVDLKPYKDPDEFIKNLGREEFEKRLENAENSLYFELRIASGGFNLSDPGEKTAFCREAAKKLAAIEDDMERDNYVGSVSAKYVIKRELMEKEVAKVRARGEGISLYETPRSGASSYKAEREDGIEKSERYLLNYLVEEPGLYAQVKAYLSPDDFSPGICRQSAGILFRQIEAGDISLPAIFDGFSGDERDRVAAIFNEKIERPQDRSELGRFLSDIVFKIKNNSLLSAAGDTDADPLESMRLKRKQAQELKNINISL